MAQLADDLDLAEKSLPRLLVDGRLGEHHFHGHGELVQLADGLVDHSHRALSQGSRSSIALDFDLLPRLEVLGGLADQCPQAARLLPPVARWERGGEGRRSFPLAFRKGPGVRAAGAPLAFGEGRG